jgi:hypothetical protein
LNLGYFGETPRHLTAWNGVIIHSLGAFTDAFV